MKNIGSCAIDLLSKFLLYDPESRIASKDALQHEFFIEGLPSPAVIAADDNCCACSANDAVPSKHIGHRVYAKVQTVPAFSASSNRAVNFDISAFIGLGTFICYKYDIF